MNITDQASWDEGLANNQDSYGACAYRYCERWANLMEERMVDAPLEEIAKQASHDANTEGITGFQYGCAVSILAHVWEHGEQLRRWHNLDRQIKDEGKKANESGGVLDPAEEDHSVRILQNTDCEEGADKIFDEIIDEEMGRPPPTLTMSFTRGAMAHLVRYVEAVVGLPGDQPL